MCAILLCQGYSLVPLEENSLIGLLRGNTGIVSIHANQWACHQALLGNADLAALMLGTGPFAKLYFCSHFVQ